MKIDNTEITEKALEEYCRKRCFVILTYDYFHHLISAKSESLNDKEKRIFLAAMSKEEKVCKEVDPDGDILLPICHEIERKVKGALWA